MPKSAQSFSAGMKYFSCSSLGFVNYRTTADLAVAVCVEVAGFGRWEGQMSRPAPSIFLFNRSYRTIPTVHAVVVQANPGVPTRFCG